MPATGLKKVGKVAKKGWKSKTFWKYSAGRTYSIDVYPPFLPKKIMCLNVIKDKFNLGETYLRFSTLLLLVEKLKNKIK